MRDALGYVVGFLISFSPTALAILASAMLSKRSTDEWQLFAWGPPLPLVGWWIWFLIAVIRDPTSHNLWPFEMVFWMLVSLALFALFLVARKLSSSRSASGRRRF